MDVGTVKVMVATVLAALAVYQVLLMSVGYGWVRVPFLEPGPAAGAHRVLGDTLVVVSLAVSATCVLGYDVSDAWEEGGPARAHVVAGSALLAVLAVKVAVVRLGGPFGRWLPALGLTVLVLFVSTWVTLALPALDGAR